MGRLQGLLVQPGDGWACVVLKVATSVHTLLELGSIEALWDLTLSLLEIRDYLPKFCFGMS